MFKAHTRPALRPYSTCKPGAIKNNYIQLIVSIDSS